MAVVTRYFSTAAAGAGDGTSWADRAQLVSGSTWSTVITGFAFNGSDSLVCLIGPGTHTTGATLASGLFANPPTVANPLFFNGCDSSGNPLTVPDPEWLSCEPAWDDSTLPVITTTTNVSTISLTTFDSRLIKYTASGRNGAVVASANLLQWCVVINSTANTAASAITAVGRMFGVVAKCTGSSYDLIVGTSVVALGSNIRVEGVTGSSGDRRGIELTSNTQAFSLVTVVNCGGDGVISTSTGTGQALRLHKFVIANNGGAGVMANSTASQTESWHLSSCMITGNGGWGLDGNSAAGRIFVSDCRFRDNTSGNITGLGNYPTDMGNYTTDAADSDEYVDAGSGDFTIKSTATIAGMGFGVAEECPASGGAAGMMLV